MPAPAAAVGYTYCAMDIEEWSLSYLDNRSGDNGFLWYEDGIWVTSTANNVFDIANGQLIGNLGLTTASRFGSYGNPHPGGGLATYNPNNNWVGTLYGPGFYIEIQAKFDASRYDYNAWGALWGNTFGQINDGQPDGSVEVDWAELYPAMIPIPSFNSGLIEWRAACSPGWCTSQGSGSDYSRAANLNDPPFSNGNWDFNTMHTYAVLMVPSQDHDGASGYMQTYVDGIPFWRAPWMRGGDYGRLDSEPFIIEIGGNYMGLGKIRVYVKDQSRMIRTF